MNQGLENKGAQGTHGSDVSHALAWFLAVRFMRPALTARIAQRMHCHARCSDTKIDSDYR